MLLDLELYVRKYTGYTVFDRLLFIAETHDEYKAQAYTLAMKECLKGFNTDMFMQLNRKITAHGLQHLVQDSIPPEFLSQATREAEAVQSRLEKELQSHKANLMKSQIRLGHLALGQFYLQKGQLQEALKSFVRARDFCNGNAHIIEMCLCVVTAALHVRNFIHVTNYAAKAEQSFSAIAKSQEASTSPPDVLTSSKIASVYGLALMHDRKYHAAAKRFTSCDIALMGHFNQVLHAEDVAVYGSLCALATFSRAELKERVIQNRAFKALLGLVPKLKELMLAFHQSKYAASLRTLATLRREVLVLDMHLHPHLDTLMAQIRARAMVEYFSPYVSVDMVRMAEVFDTKLESFEKELRRLIVKGKIEARIDSQTKIMYSNHQDQRGSTYRKAFQVGQTYLADTKAILLRMSIIKNELAVGQQPSPPLLEHPQHPRRAPRFAQGGPAPEDVVHFEEEMKNKY